MPRFSLFVSIFALMVAVLLTGCANYVRDQIYKPSPLSETPVAFERAPPTEVTTLTADQLELSGYYWPPTPGNDSLLVFFHGNGGNQLVGAALAEPFHYGGHGVLVASYRGYGDNPGEPSEDGLLDDAEAWLALADSIAPEAQIYLFGYSLGGAVALEMASRHPVSGVATLGAFSRLSDIAPSYASGVLPDRFDNLQTIAKVKTPIFLFHGTQDEQIAFSSAEKLLAAAANGNAQVIPLHGGGHLVPMDKLAPLAWNYLDPKED